MNQTVLQVVTVTMFFNVSGLVLVGFGVGLLLTRPLLLSLLLVDSRLTEPSGVAVVDALALDLVSEAVRVAYPMHHALMGR